MHIVIVSYLFPPSNAIGGRRWSKLCLALKDTGNEITVVTTNANQNQQFYQTEYTGISFVELPNTYPEWMTGHTNSILDKLKYYFTVKFISFFSKQNYFDKTFASKKHCINTLKKIHSNNPIDVLICTGAPYSLLFYGALFKINYPTVKYIMDLRDPWTWCSYYGIPQMHRVKKMYQKYQELYSIKQSDLVCFPTDYMGLVLKEKYPDFSNKFYLLPHAFDPKKFLISNCSINQKNGFIYGGTLYDGIEPYLKSLSKVLRNYPNSSFNWNIYSSKISSNIKSIFENQNVTFNDYIPESELFNKIHESAVYLMFYPIADKDLVSTKFFEIINIGIPILYIGEEGEVSKFIVSNKCGAHILPKNIESEMPKYLNGDVPYQKNYFDVSQFTFDKVSHKFYKELKNRFFINI